MKNNKENKKLPTITVDVEVTKDAKLDVVIASDVSSGRHTVGDSIEKLGRDVANLILFYLHEECEQEVYNKITNPEELPKNDCQW